MEQLEYLILMPNVIIKTILFPKKKKHKAETQRKTTKTTQEWPQLYPRCGEFEVGVIKDFLLAGKFH